MRAMCPKKLKLFDGTVPTLVVLFVVVVVVVFLLLLTVSR
jgi:hypothetical protein